MQHMGFSCRRRHPESSQLQVGLEEFRHRLALGLVFLKIGIQANEEGRCIIQLGMYPVRKKHQG